ncbi:MAG: DMT family transporter [Phycisphaerales bacterium]|nr:MAG: DMT family transporter [Phycisphaerales bacterium]
MNEHTAIRKFDVTATLACIGTLSAWSLGPIFISYLAGFVDSWTQNLLRYSAACLFWLPLLLFSLKKKRFDNRIWKKALLPATANVIMQSLWAAAFYYVGPAFMVLLTKTNIIWVASFSLMFFPEERPLARSKRFWAGLVLSALGVVGVIYFKEDFAATGTLTGVIIAMAAAFMWGAYTISVKITFRDVSSREGFSVISAYTVAGLAVAALLFGDIGRCVTMGVWQWASVVFSGVTAIALGHVFYYAAIKRIGATIPALVILAQPFAVLAISRVVFGESLNVLQLLFGAILLVGAGLAIWAQQHLRRQP